MHLRHSCWTVRIAGVAAFQAVLATVLASPIDQGVADCGVQCLAVSLNQLGRSVTYEEIASEIGDPAGTEGYSLGQLMEVAESRGFKTLLVDTKLSTLQRRPKPFACIAHVDDGTHFIVIIGLDATRRTIQIFDPKLATKIKPLATHDYEVLERRWRGTALLIAESAILKEEEIPAASWPWWLYIAAAAVLSASVATWLLGSRRNIAM
jgi:ABC-type bacteriocin/lantibiotic exporter with double-glycine peptidase domain